MGIVAWLFVVIMPTALSWHKAGLHGRQFVRENLTKEVGTQKYVDVIKSFEK